MTVNQLKIELANSSYPIQIGSGILASIPKQLMTHDPTQVFILFDENVRPHLQTVQSALDDASQKGDWNVPVQTLEIPSGETSKSVDMAQRAWEFLAEHRADRKSLIVALGGGVVGDLAGFVAATYARGIRFFQVPTTLLAQVDSSVGGKTGINISSAKNMVGSFWQPVGVVIDIETLSTLAQREYLSGLAEVVKYGLIMDQVFFERLEQNTDLLVNRDADMLVEIIAHCCRLKAEVVQEDEKETTGRRAILNYGHTFAHAFETVYGYGKYLHGEAVGVGMLCAGDLARRLGRVNNDFCSRQHRVISALGLPVRMAPTEFAPLIEVMRRDKKNVGDVIRFILPNRIGDVELIEQKIDIDVLNECLRAYVDRG